MGQFRVENLSSKGLCWVVVGGLILTSLAWAGRTDQPRTEYEVKAAFIYNFLLFAQWPGETSGGPLSEPNSPMVIAIVEPDPFGRVLEAIPKRGCRGHPIEVRRIRVAPDLTADQKQQLRACQILFLPGQNDEVVQPILDAVRGHPVMTAGETPQFLETGGMVRFFLEDQRVRFSINLVEARAGGLQISSDVLRLAKEVKTESRPDLAKDAGR